MARVEKRISPKEKAQILFDLVTKQESNPEDIILTTRSTLITIKVTEIHAKYRIEYKSGSEYFVVWNYEYWSKVTEHVYDIINKKFNVKLKY